MLHHDGAKVRILDEEGLNVGLALHGEVVPLKSKEFHDTYHSTRPVKVHRRLALQRRSSVVGDRGREFLQIQRWNDFRFTIEDASCHLQSKKRERGRERERERERESGGGGGGGGREKIWRERAGGEEREEKRTCKDIWHCSNCGNLLTLTRPDTMI